MSACVVGLGQEAGGDDAVGLVVVRAVSALAPSIATVLARDASELVDILMTPGRVVLVDAVVGAGSPGRVFQLDPDALADGPSPVSSHMVPVAQALRLARALTADGVGPSIRIVGISIDRPEPLSSGLSPAVLAAVQPAADLVLTLVRE